ncbi:WD40-repeat-containing domain protein [Vararia minispora EC-137]|uniref:WD40-repeat-containing domain protein n=1 Tax=Vararia minispora EC-137 TaxID=1314806 RepID=A0ACB8QVZ2_9AGAM|nr:WD40-repeat-containing domain protein [Vararia minispora EC-137]
MHKEPSRPLLNSFVSSASTDNFVCHSAAVDSFVTPPYACAYSYAARRGGVPHLAVATEQGSVYIWNTERRLSVDVAAHRIDLNVHDNGVFDVQWSPSDDRLATASADHTTRITDPIAGRVLCGLHGHTQTAKTVAWHPSHADLVATGARDGSICLWDLRVHDRLLKSDGQLECLGPVATIRCAHEEMGMKGGKRPKTFSPRAVTSLVYSPLDPHGLISSGSANGILRHWDLRFPKSRGKTKAARDNSIPAYMSPLDPTMLDGGRARGITSLVAGMGPSGSTLFALGCDSRVHSYTLPSLHPLSESHAHPSMTTNSFYARLAISPCGRWLATGSTSGAAFVFDVSQVSILRRVGPKMDGVRLHAQVGEVTAVSWAEGMLATCSDDGTVRVWRVDSEGIQATAHTEDR